MMQKSFGIKSAQKSTNITLKSIILVIVYSCLTILTFFLFSFYAKITGWIFSENKIDIFQELDQVAFYFWPFDQELSQKLLQLDTIMQAYFTGENVLQSYKSELFQLWDYFSQHREYLNQIGFEHYDALLSLLADSYDLREEVFHLLGEKETFNYLILLQNGNEKRPNGGFFGSFAFVTLSGGHLVEMQIVDSYLPDYVAPNTRLPLPTWTKAFLGEANAGFVAGNKFGFTDLDGKNIKTLYEKAFHTDYIEERKQAMFSPEKWDQLFEKNIKGVVFLDSEMVNFLLPAFKNVAWEWQFINANIDLIRGENRSNKKEIYIQSLESYLKTHLLSLVKNTVNTFGELLSKGYLNVYLSNVSNQLWGLLQAHDLTTVYQPEMLYFWNINSAYNKSDAFIDKQIFLQDAEGKTLFSSNNNKIALPYLDPGFYRLYFSYAFDLPKSYQDEMYALESKYGIQMTDRERYILSLEPLDPINKPFPIMRETTEIGYLPDHIQVRDFHGDFFNEAVFDAGFAHGFSFKSKIAKNQKTNLVWLDLEVL